MGNSDLDKPWQTLDSQVIHSTPWHNLREDVVQTHTNSIITYTYLDHPGAVAVVPITQQEKVVLVYQYRYTVGEWCWEVPIGGRVSRESNKETAKRELLEEIGGIPEGFQFISSFFASNSTSNIECDVFLASGVVMGENNPEDTELIKVVTKSKQEVLNMVRSGIMKDGMSALAILLCESHW